MFEILRTTGFELQTSRIGGDFCANFPFPNMLNSLKGTTRKVSMKHIYFETIKALQEPVITNDILFPEILTSVIRCFSNK